MSSQRTCMFTSDRRMSLNYCLVDVLSVWWNAHERVKTCWHHCIHLALVENEKTLKHYLRNR